MPAVLKRLQLTQPITKAIVRSDAPEIQCKRYMRRAYLAAARLSREERKVAGAQPSELPTLL